MDAVLWSKIKTLEETISQLTQTVDDLTEKTVRDSGQGFIRFEDGTQIVYEIVIVEFDSIDRLSATMQFPPFRDNNYSATGTLNDSIMTPYTSELAPVRIGSREPSSLIVNLGRAIGRSDFEEGDWAEIGMTLIGRWK